MAPPPRRTDGQSHLGAGKAAAGPLAPNAAGRAAGRGGGGFHPACGHLSAHQPRLPRRGKAQPMAGAGGADVLVRTGAGREGSGAGEHQRLPRAHQARPARRPQGSQPHRGAGHPAPDAGRGDQSRRGDCGRERQRRRHCAAAVYAPWRGPAGTDLQGHQHDGQYAGLQKREVPLLWPRRRKTRRCGELSAQPVGRAALVRRCGPDREQPEGRMAHLAAGPAQPRQPQQRPDRERLCRGARRPVGRARLLFRRVLRKTYHRRPAPAH